MRILIAAALSALMVLPAAAEGEFSEGSEAVGWKNVQGREPARFKGKVVDILCELSGDCTEKCGEGRRQMGIVRESDGALVLASKNNQASFAGATVELAPFCNQTVTIDGLLVGNPELTKTKFLQVQLITPEGASEATQAKAFGKAWAKANPEAAKKKGPWFRKDPAINAEIEKEGYLGLSKDADIAFIKDWY